MMNDNITTKNKRSYFLEMIVQILKEQFSNIKPSREKINKYLDEYQIDNNFINA